MVVKRARVALLAALLVLVASSSFSQCPKLESQATKTGSDPIWLSLSGGGYRAMLFHAGALWSLNELGLLPDLREVSSVSGGSLTAGVLATRWQDLDWRDDCVASNFATAVVQPLLDLASTTIRTGPVIKGALLPVKVSTLVARKYDRHLKLDGKTLQDLPDSPRFAFNATSLHSGSVWVFSKKLQGDSIIGYQQCPGNCPETPLSKVLASSAAFPPVLSPSILRLPECRGGPCWTRAGVYPSAWESARRQLPEDDPDLKKMRRRVALTDGGVADNLGLASLRRTYGKEEGLILASDGGGRFKIRPRKGWFQLYRVLQITKSLPSDLRTERLIEDYQKKFLDDQLQGAFWSMRYEEWGEGAQQRARDLGIEAQLRATKTLAETPTDLKKLDSKRAKRLVNFGYVAAELALGTYKRRSEARESCKALRKLPFPQGLGESEFLLGCLCSEEATAKITIDANQRVRDEESSMVGAPTTLRPAA